MFFRLSASCLSVSTDFAVALLAMITVPYASLRASCWKADQQRARLTRDQTSTGGGNENDYVCRYRMIPTMPPGSRAAAAPSRGPACDDLEATPKGDSIPWAEGRLACPWSLSKSGLQGSS